MAGMSQARADSIAAQLQIGLDVGICHACLGFVCIAIEAGNPRDVARETRRVTRDLWAEGLAEPALTAVRAACASGIHDADEALADLELAGGSSIVARSIVRCLAEKLVRRTNAALRFDALVREQFPITQPEL